MKKVLPLFMSIIFISFTFSSCNEPAPEIDYSDKYIEGQDAQESNFAYQMSASFAETDESLYAFVLDTFFVIDKQSHKAMPLCSKPDCKHDRHSPDCEAQKIGSAREYMGKLYYKYRADKKDENGIIYYVDQICSMNYDGTDKKVVFETKRDTFLISYFKLHRGYFYMWIRYQDDEGGYSSDNAELVRLKIGDTEPESILDLSDGKELLDVRFYGNNMYLLYHEAKGENGDFSAVFLRYDIRTLEYEDINEKLDYPVSWFFTICNGKIVYSDVNDQSNICICALDGSDNSIAADLCDTFGKDAYDYYSVMSSNDNGIMISASKEDDKYHKTMILCDKAFEHFESCDVPEAANPEVICSGDLMLMLGQGGEGEFYNKNETIQLWIADKTKLGHDGWVEMVAEVAF